MLATSPAVLEACSVANASELTSAEVRPTSQEEEDEGTEVRSAMHYDSEGWIFTLFGLPVILLSLRRYARGKRMQRDGIHTQGRAIRQKRDPDGDIPVIAFSDQHGNQVEFTPDMVGSGLGIPTGQEVPVVYFADTPWEARVDTPRFMNVWLLFMFCGIAVTGFGLLVMTGMVTHSQ